MRMKIMLFLYKTNFMCFIFIQCRCCADAANKPVSPIINHLHDIQDHVPLIMQGAGLL